MSFNCFNLTNPYVFTGKFFYIPIGLIIHRMEAAYDN